MQLIHIETKFRPLVTVIVSRSKRLSVYYKVPTYYIFVVFSPGYVNNPDGVTSLPWSVVQMAIQPILIPSPVGGSYSRAVTGAVAANKPASVPGNHFV